MRTRWKVLLGIVGLAVIGILIWVSVLGCSEYGKTKADAKGVISIGELRKELEERMGGVSVSDVSILDTAPVQGLKIYMKGGDRE